MSADEFDIIRNHFAPLATHEGARKLIDDAAVLEAHGKIVITTDAIVEGVHFLPNDPIDTIAKKAVRVNLSDLAAKGAKPIGIVLSLIWPETRPAAQIADFARGLGEDLKRYGLALLGGDTTSTPGPLTINITALGEPIGARVPSRGDAKPGEQLWITGTIGDAMLGLIQLTAKPGLLGAKPEDRNDAHARHVRERYRVPEPPAQAAALIGEYARASIDVSDGLIADAEKIAAASGAALRIDAEAIPLSSAAHAYAQMQGAEGFARLITGGDDYQTLFTAAPEHRYAIMQAAKAASVDLALIGDVLKGEGVRVLGANGAELHIPTPGHRHKLGR